MITNPQSGTRVDEVAPAVYRISTPVSIVPGGFSFNQYLVVDDEPLLFHTGPRRMFPLVREAIAAVMPVERLRWVAFSHVEADECGALNELLAAAPAGAAALRPHRRDGLGRRPRRPAAARPGRRRGDRPRPPRVRWLDAPHLPHAWECGYLFEETTRTLFCGDLFTQPGAEHPPVTDGRHPRAERGDARGHGLLRALARGRRALLEKLAATKPRTLACMHGSAWSGDGARMLLDLADALSTSSARVETVETGPPAKTSGLP